MTEVYLLHQDCRTIDPRTLGHTSVITDPPYSAHVHERMTSNAQSEDIKGVRHRDAGFAPLSPELRAYIAEACRCAPAWSLVYTDVQGNAAWEQALGGYGPDDGPRHVRTIPVTGDTSGASGYGDTEGGPVGTLPWVRWSMPQFSGTCPPSGCELIVCAHGPGRMHWRGPGNLIELKHTCLRGDDKHPTEKPLDQALDLVSWFTDPGDLVCDPCAGRGTLGVACAVLGRNYVGCEWGAEDSADHVRIGLERIASAFRGEFSDRDANRLMRWRVSVGIPGSGNTVPDEFKALRKGVREEAAA